MSHAPNYQQAVIDRNSNPGYIMHDHSLKRGLRMNFKRFSATVIAVLAALLLSAIPGYGQLLKGTILGTITDVSHGVVPMVAVNLTEVNTNLRLTQNTNESGFFAFP